MSLIDASSEKGSVLLSLQPRITGTMVNYAIVCSRKLWLFSRGLGQEQTSELVALGTLIHQESFKRRKKEILIMGRIKIDHTTAGERIVVHEVKKTRSYSHAARAQLLFYLYELEKLGLQCRGELHFRSNRRKEAVSLDDDGREYVRTTIQKVQEILKHDTAPAPPSKAPCKRCAYRDYCRM